MSLPLYAADRAQAWPVLVVSADAAHIASVRQAFIGWPVPVVMSTASNAMAAMRQALALPMRLVVVDWAVDGTCGQALVRQLARLRPALPVLAFDTVGVDGPADRVLAWPWSEVTPLLDRWLVLALERAAAKGDRP